MRITGMINQPSRSGATSARPGDVAVLEELEAARASNTLVAYDLFLARHPNHPLSVEAVRERARLIEHWPADGMKK